MRLLPHRIWFSKTAATHGGRALGIDVLIFFALIALLLVRATAAVHPVPLDPKTDSAKCIECHNSDDNREFGGTGPNGLHGSKWTHILERRYEFSQTVGPGQLITNLFQNPDLSVNGPYAMCGKCHNLQNVVGNNSFTQHSRHINDGFTCSVCHTAHGMGGINPNISGERLVNFDVNVVAQNGAAPISYSRSTNTCVLMCHQAAHNPNGSVSALSLHSIGGHPVKR